MPHGPGASKAFAIATKVAKEKGYHNFSEGSPGRALRGRLAEEIAEKAAKRSKKKKS